ncbi:hypothetical protein [Catenulispora rubra]|uniref:hypothetical protein n=1 Tax=Catenulispora rubra TaxID=280293 RepID=UPI00189265FF|nr:hypothetical protein [Catenulispora rubra]
MRKYLCAVALIISVAGCTSSTKAGGGAGPLLPPAGVVTRVAEISYSGGFVVRSALAAPAVVVYSDGSVVFNAQKRLTLTPGALDYLVQGVQQDLKGQSSSKVLVPKSGHAIPDGAITVLGVYQPGGAYQTVRALVLNASTESEYPAPVADAFAKLQALTSDATTPYTATKVRYEMQCPPDANGPVQPWPAGLPQPGVADCTEVHSTDGAAATAVRAACTGVDTPSGKPQPAATVYRSDKGPRICRWRYALPDETS